MAQIGENVAVSIEPTENPQKCIFCQKDHQDEKEEAPHPYQNEKNTKNLKKNGQQYIKEMHSIHYPDVDKPPLVNWSKDIRESGGYKAAAHHCIATKVLHNHTFSGELKKIGYDPDRGSNCILLPYSKRQFSRARALNKPLQKHRGGHTGAYYEIVDEHLANLARKVEQKFCKDNKKADKETILRWMGIEERHIFNGVRSVIQEAYRLYNTSYLNPRQNWGSYDWEKGITENAYLDDKEDFTEESNAELENQDDPDE